MKSDPSKPSSEHQGKGYKNNRGQDADNTYTMLHGQYMLHEDVYRLNHLSELYANVLTTCCFNGSAHALHVQLAGSAYIAYVPWATYHGYAATMRLWGR